MFDYLVSIVNSLGQWGYLVIFFVVALECQAKLGLFMPGESLVLLGFFAEQGLLALVLVLPGGMILSMLLKVAFYRLPPQFHGFSPDLPGL